MLGTTIEQATNMSVAAGLPPAERAQGISVAGFLHSLDSLHNSGCVS
jgi:hypothetical protein